MKWSFAGVAIIAAGLIGLVIIWLFQDITTRNEQDYYLLKEVAEAAMIDSVDLAYYRETGEPKIVKEKFVENFIRRFSESVGINSNSYKLDFYDIIEVPPKVSIRVSSKTGTFTVNGDAVQFDLVNQIDAILETRY